MLYNLNIMKRITFYLFLLAFLFPPPASAYLDPGSGSYVIQVIVASLLGSLFFIKGSWQKLKNLIFKIKKSNGKRTNVKKDRGS